MGDMVASLVPEMLGLFATPAAVIACLLLLGSPRPWRNVALFASMFLCVYGALSLATLAAGRIGGGSGESSTVRGWSSAVLGLLFLGLGILALLRHPPDPQHAEPMPAWAVRLTDPPLRFVVLLGLALAILNPNIAILGSGLGIVLTADVSLSGQLVGVGLLLLASMLDFVVPSVAVAASGERGHERLRLATRWLVAHNRLITAFVLVGFGLLFSLRGLVLLSS